MTQFEIDGAIKHYNALQKRYVTLHDGKNCDITNTAIKALKKQLEKDVEEIIGDNEEPIAVCGACGHMVWGNYCDKCGQKLKWEEEND